MTKRTGYRGLEFHINRLDDWRWEWAFYPDKGEVARLTGCIHGSEGTATAVAQAAIDGWMAAKSI